MPQVVLNPPRIVALAGEGQEELSGPGDEGVMGTKFMTGIGGYSGLARAVSAFDGGDHPMADFLSHGQ